MQTQNYDNHIRYYPPHHYVFLPLMGLLMTTGIIKAYCDRTHTLEWLLFSTLSFCILYLAIMLRQHYALNNQNRIVRLEVYYRYFASTNKRLDTLEKPLSFSQLAALRFASDEEFVSLTERAIQEGLTSDQIKRSIKQWKPDYMRA